MDTPFDPALEDDIKQLLTEVPQPIRAFFASGKVEAVAKNLMQKYRLHIDQSAIMEREIILLLLGLKNPAEFTQALAEEAKIEPQMVKNIVQDVNTQIFIPLQAEEMKGGEMKKEQPPEHFHLENKLPTTEEKLLEDREEPHIEINQIKKPVLPTNLPGAIPPAQQKPVSPIPPVPSKPYSVDPYREPIDEK